MSRLSVWDGSADSGPVTNRDKVLVTGATGFLGRRLVTRFIREGYLVRAFARRQSDVRALTKLGAEVAFGDLGDKSSIAAAVMGVQLVVHAGAGTQGTAKDSSTGTVQGTRNVLEACRRQPVKKLVHISSCSVYEVAGYIENGMVTEEAQLERSPERRGHYSAAKLKAEAMVTESMTHGEYPKVVLRPGTLYGPGSTIFPPMMGISFAPWAFIVFGDGESKLPLVHVDSVVDAIVRCMTHRAADNQIFNVVDQELVTKKMYMERVVRQLYPRAKVIYCPMPMLLTLTRLQEMLMAILRLQPILTVYRLTSSQGTVRYGATKIRDAIGWQSQVRFEQGAEQLVAFLREHGYRPDIS